MASIIPTPPLGDLSEAISTPPQPLPTDPLAPTETPPFDDTDFWESIVPGEDEGIGESTDELAWPTEAENVVPLPVPSSILEIVSQILGQSTASLDSSSTATVSVEPTDTTTTQLTETFTPSESTLETALPTTAELGSSSAFSSRPRLSSTLSSDPSSISLSSSDISSTVSSLTEASSATSSTTWTPTVSAALSTSSITSIPTVSTPFSSSTTEPTSTVSTIFSTSSTTSTYTSTSSTSPSFSSFPSSTFSTSTRSSSSNSDASTTITSPPPSSLLTSASATSLSTAFPVPWINTNTAPAAANLKPRVVAGATIGSVFAFLVLIASVVFFLLRKRRHKYQLAPVYPQEATLYDLPRPTRAGALTISRMVPHRSGGRGMLETNPGASVTTVFGPAGPPSQRPPSNGRGPPRVVLADAGHPNFGAGKLGMPWSPVESSAPTDFGGGRLSVSQNRGLTAVPEVDEPVDGMRSTGGPAWSDEADLGVRREEDERVPLTLANYNSPGRTHRQPLGDLREYHVWERT